LETLLFSQTDLSNVFKVTFTHISKTDYKPDSRLTIINSTTAKLVSIDKSIQLYYTISKRKEPNTYIFVGEKDPGFTAKLYLADKSTTTKVYSLELQNGLIFSKIVRD
jgi:hypothetical protein